MRQGVIIWVMVLLLAVVSGTLALAQVAGDLQKDPACKYCGMDRQTLRDWVHRYNAGGPEGLFDHWTNGPKPRLSSEQLAEFARIVEAGPDREQDGEGPDQLGPWVERLQQSILSRDLFREQRLFNRVGDVAQSPVKDEERTPVGI